MAGESQQVPSTPPDPSTLTTEQMLLAIENLEKLVSAWRETDRSQCIEQFESIKTQLKLVETQRVEQKSDTKAAVDAALSAAKEAVKEQTTASQLATNKTETSFAEQLKQQESKFSLALTGVTTSVHDVKERVAEMQAARRASFAIASASVAFLTLVVGSLALVLSR